MTTPQHAGDLTAVIAQMRAAAADVQVLEHELAAARARRNRAARTLAEAGMTQRAIAEHLGVSESRVTRLLGYGPFDDDTEPPAPSSLPRPPIFAADDEGERS